MLCYALCYVNLGSGNTRQIQNPFFKITTITRPLYIKKQSGFWEPAHLDCQG